MGGLIPMEILQGLAGFNTNAVDSIGCFSKNPSPIGQGFFFLSVQFYSTLQSSEKSWLSFSGTLPA